MRTAARHAGVMVDLPTIDDPNPKQEKYVSHIGRKLEPKLKVAAYRKQRPRPDDWRKQPKVDWCWQKILESGWQWSEKPQDMAEELEEWLEAEIPNLPEDVEQVEETAYNIVVYWHERQFGNEQLIFEFLNTCADLPLHKPPEDDDVE